MINEKNKFLVGISIGIVSLFTFAWSKAQEMLAEYSEAIQKFTYSIESIRNIQVKGNLFKGEGVMNFVMDMKLMNNSDKSFNLSAGSTILLESVQFFDKQGNYLGIAKPNLSSITVGSQSSVLINAIGTQLQVNRFRSIIDALNSGTSIQNMLVIKPTIRIAGKRFEL